jgi:hypothetical protein
MSIGLNASKNNSSQNEWSNSNQNTKQQTDQTAQQAGTGSRAATFDNPYAQSILSALSGQVGQPAPQMGASGQQAASVYGGLTGATPAVNPNVESLIASSNKEGDQVLGNNLAKVRAGGFRGGTGANMYGQTEQIANAANTRAKDNSSLRYGAYEADANRGVSSKLAGASGLAGLENMQQGAQQSQSNLGTQLLALLRGESTAQQGTSTGQTTSIQDIISALTGGKSGTSSTVGGSAGFSI